MSDSGDVEFESIIIKGTKFFYEKSGKQFFARGVDYGPTNGATDFVLENGAACEIDAGQMKGAGVNLIYVSLVNRYSNHTRCMRAFQSNGIYVAARIGDHFLTHPTWTREWNGEVAGYVDNLAPFSNLLGLFLSNQNAAIGVVPPKDPLPVPGYAITKSALRDLKLLIRERGYRKIPIGVAGSDIGSKAFEVQYLRCGLPAAQAIDFWIQFLPSRCSLVSSPGLISPSNFNSYGIPLLLGDYVCSQQDVSQGRNFSETNILYGNDVTTVWSGGFVYKWREDPERLGLFALNQTSSGTVIGLSRDYETFKRQLSTVSPRETALGEYTPSEVSATQCRSLGGDWPIPSTIPPSPKDEVCNCLLQAMPCRILPNTPTEDAESFSKALCLTNPKACRGTLIDLKSGTYGAFSFCDSLQKLSWQLSYARSKSSDPKTCGGSNIGNYVQTREPEMNSFCANLMTLAGDEGDKVIDAFELVSSPSSSASATAPVKPHSPDVSQKSSGDSPNSPSKGLNAGAIAGIVIGICIAIGFVIGGYLLRKRRRKQQLAQSHGMETGLPPASFEKVTNVELDGTATSENGGTNGMLQGYGAPGNNAGTLGRESWQQHEHLLGVAISPEPQEMDGNPKIGVNGRKELDTVK